ncbi:hypothetical protein [Patiriisocius marinus]|uniref:DUF3558 domain-containing protein n=1 Tax=Patiriisocius marinus TaxID=1397112 RepID=A0A5J4J038_9FLAO|nr:hypothetical protein [Patiriisocius marinus]GER60606.1 hypothetical protein ULMA_27140 [Patiriisocius marinus]
MKNLKTKTIVILLSVFTMISCGNDDDDTPNDGNESGLISIGDCGTFFVDVNLQSLCGVEAANSQGLGTGAACTYIIRQNVSASQELYGVTLWEAASINDAVDFYELLGDDFFPGEMLSPLNGLGDEAIYAEDQENQDFTVLFRLRNINVAVVTDELFFELGCDDPQASLIELANLIIEKAQ